MPSLPPILGTRQARIVAIVLASLLAARGALPYALARAVSWGGERTTGLVVSLANVDLGLLQGRLALDGLSVAGPGNPPAQPGVVDPQTALLAWQRLALDFAWLDLLRGRLRLSELSLSGPRGRLELDDAGRPILPEIAAEPEAAPAEPDEGGSWPILVDRLALSDLAFELRDVREDPALSLGLEGLELSAVSYDATGLSLGAIGIRAPSLRVRRDYLLGERAPATEPSAKAAAGAEPAAPPSTYRMEQLHVERAEFTLLTDAGPIHMALRMEATGVTTTPGTRFPLELGLEVERGGIELAGELGVAPPGFAGTLRWRELPLPAFVMLARPDLASWVVSHSSSGELAVDFRMEADARAPAGVRLSGTAASENLLFRDPARGDLSLGWKRFEIVVDEVFVPLGDAAAATPLRVALGSVRLVEPRVFYRQPCPALDVLLGTGSESAAGSGAEPGPEGEPGPQPVVSIASFEVVDGGAGFEDRGVRPAFAGRIRSLALTAADVRLPATSVGRLSLSAVLPGRSRLTVQGSHGESRSDLRSSLLGLPLAPFSSYATSAAGYRVDEGQLSLDTKARRDARGWSVSNDLLLHRLRLSPTGSGRLDQMIGVPVDLAMALLRDLEGNVRLGIPIAFGARGVRVGIGSVVRDALQAAIVGAATSPLKMMGAAFSLAGGSGLSVEPLRMEPGGSVLVAGQEEGLAALVALLETRPELAVRLAGIAADADRDGLAVRILVERIAAGGDLPELEDAGFLARRRVRGALARRGRGEAGDLDGEDAALLARYVGATFVPPERFDALAHERAQAVSALLVASHGLASEAVRVADETPRGDPGVRIQLEAR